jgi:DNA topoisomerase-2
MCYNPLQIIEYIKNKLVSIEYDIPFIPYYEGFKGSVTKLSEDKFLIKGLYEKIGPDKIKVTELPVGNWTEDFKELLEELIEPSPGKDGKKVSPIIKDYDDMSKDTNVDFTITFAKGKLEEFESNKGEYGCNGLEKLLKLYTTNSTTNMHLFDSEDTLKKFDKISDIIDSYYDVRLKLYQTRKNFMIAALEKELVLLSNKAKYIQENLDGTIDLRKKKKEQVIELLSNKGYDIIDNDGEYKYLTKMPMDSVTEENVEKLLKDKGNKEVDLETIKNKTINKMWIEELDVLRNLYVEYKEDRSRLMSGEDGNGKSIKKKVVSKGPIKKSVKSNEGKKLMVIEDE